MLQSFLSAHNVKPAWLNDADVDTYKYFSLDRMNSQAAAFTYLSDTVLFSEVVASALHKIPAGKISTIIDLGSGSSLPTIKALRDNPQHAANVVAVDANPDCIATGQRNAEYFGLTARYRFIEDDMLHALSAQKLGADTLIVSNPPYMPVPPDSKNPKYLPVDGGPDGTKFLEAILKAPIPPGGYVALLWSSLGNPNKVISLIEKDFEVLHVNANNVRFGIYSKELLPYMQPQRDRGLAEFDKNGDTFSYIVMGSVLCRKGKTNGLRPQ